MSVRALYVCLLTAGIAVAGAVELNPLTGGVDLTRVDLEVGEGDASYTLQRSYRPELAVTGWHWSCDSRLLMGKTPTWIDEDGAGVAFVARGAGWVAARGTPYRLRVIPGAFALETPERSYRFDLAGRLVERTTRGTTLRFSHGPQGAVGVSGPWGELALERGPGGVLRAALESREVRYAYRAGRLAGVARDTLRERYAYDELGRLAQADETQVRYDDAGRVSELVGGRIPLHATYSVAETEWTCALREGTSETTYTYRSGSRPFLEVREAGSTRTIRYDERLRPVAAEREGVLERSWRYDARGRLAQVHAPSGDLRLSYDGAYRPCTTTLPSGEELRFVYDEAGRLLAATSASGTERFAYDAQGQLVGHQDANGSRTQLERDARGYLVGIKAQGQTTHVKRSVAGDVLAVKHPDGRVVEYTERGAAVKVVDGEGTVQASAFDSQGRMIAYQDEFGRASRVTYNGFGLIARAYDKDGDRFRCDYDEHGQLTAVTDAASNTVSYTRPDAHTLIVDDPSAGRRELRFNAAGQVVQETRGAATLRFRYDEAGRLIARTTPRGEERFTYDRAGRMLSQAGPDGELRYSYDAQGRLLTSENRVLFETISYRYEGAHTEPSEVVYPWGSVSYRYDTAGKLTGVRAGEQEIAIERTADGRRASVRYANGVETRYRYSGSQLSEVASWREKTLLTKRAYRYDARGRIAAVTDEGDRETTFSHDRRGRLLTATGPERSVRYSYDAAGNRSAVEVGGELAEVEVGAGNRVLAHAGTTYTYGSHGALVGREGPEGKWRYAVDVDGRLRSASGPQRQSVRYGYAPDGTPLWREANGEREGFLVDRQQVVGEFKDGAVARSYVRGEGLDDLLLSEAPGQTGQSWTFHRDLVGSVTALSDEAGEVVARYGYGAFGEALSAEGPAADANRWRFAGRPLDAVSGLYDVRARHYDASLGRFTAPDPSGREGGLNLYAYAENDPTRLTDPLGLSAELGTRSQQTAAPKRGFFGRMLDRIESVGQSLPGPARFVYNVAKGIGQAAKDTVVGIGELFKKETWVALGEFVSELDDWETVKAVGKHLLDAGIDVGKRYVDAALNDPDEFARMTGYGAAMIAGSVLGSKGIDKLANVARTARAARLARRAVDTADDVVDARRRLTPILVAGANAGEDVVDVAEDVADVAGSPSARKGIAQALDEDSPVGNGVARNFDPEEELTQGVRDLLDSPIAPEVRAGLAQRSRDAAERAAELRRQDGRFSSDLVDRERMGGSGTVRGNHGGKAGTDGAGIAAANFRKADDLVREWVDTNEPLTIDKIKQLNATLGEGLEHNGGTPGAFRSPGQDVMAGGAPAKVYVLGNRVRDGMQDFMTWYRTAEASGMDPIELAAGSYQRLVSLHPFLDANGRTSRLVMDYVLQKNGLPPAAMIDANVAVFGAERALKIPGLSTTPAQALEKVTAGVERSLELLGGGGR